MIVDPCSNQPGSSPFCAAAAQQPVRSAADEAKRSVRVEATKQRVCSGVVMSGSHPGRMNRLHAALVSKVSPSAFHRSTTYAIPVGQSPWQRIARLLPTMRRGLKVV
jgi:hypothetical protein